MCKGSEKAALAVHTQISRSPDRRCPDIAGEDCVVCGELIDQSSDVLRMNGRFTGLTCRELVQAFSDFMIVIGRSLKVLTVRLLFKERKQCGDGVFDAP